MTSPMLPTERAAQIGTRHGLSYAPKLIRLTEAFDAIRLDVVGHLKTGVLRCVRLYAVSGWSRPEAETYAEAFQAAVDPQMQALSER
ncbi:hypothetical protein ACRBEV_10170 [Methylobacterium phyllosphaerae]